MDPSNESQPGEVQLAELSAAFDEYGVSSQLTEVAVRLGISDSLRQQLVSDWQQTALRLKNLPVAEADVSMAVLNRIQEQKSESGLRLANQLDSSSAVADSKRRSQLAKIFALATSSLAMLFIALQVATHERSLNRSAEVLASFSFDPQVWDVVVVTVSDEQANQLSKDLGQTSAAGDLKMVSLLANQDSEAESIGVMMASKEISQKLLVKFAEAPAASSAEWNPKMVGELGREELLERFAVSMKTPTKSDMYFREVIVVTSDQDNGFQVSSRSTDSTGDVQAIAKAGDVQTEDFADAESQSRQKEGESILMQMQNHRQRPVMVVFKRRSETGPDSQGSLVPAKSGFAAYL